MSSLIGLVKKLFWTQVAFSRLETAIFDAVQGQLSPKDAELWGRQLKAVHKIYRSPDGRHVNWWVMRNGKSAFPQELCFTRTDEFKVAVVDLTAKQAKAKLRARVWCVNGHVFSIEYKTPFRVFEQAAQGEWEVSCHIVSHPS
ncbi:hypothetical protein F2P45_21065 [Massilia sp. CCM 8733]|uniref:Uncharacterized protein n=1 Tax=Massilia mucilaginosa TaxID=2609282 RepID=A0ABX0NX80_9BURK|nr:hypothetical protein [Massilia mucilaginosa]NHZ91477.1 hypothetical protein [Massilia mucilaginosa]